MEKLVDKTVPVSLEGQDGNAFSLLAFFKTNAKKAGWLPGEIEIVIDQAISGDYDNLVATLFLYCEEPEE